MSRSRDPPGDLDSRAVTPGRRGHRRRPVRQRDLVPAGCRFGPRPSDSPTTCPTTAAAPPRAGGRPAGGHRGGRHRGRGDAVERDRAVVDRLRKRWPNGGRGGGDPGDPRRRPHDRVSRHRRGRPARRLGPGLGRPFDAHADTGEEPVRGAVRPRDADAEVIESGRPAETGSCRSGCGATGRSPRPWPGWPSRGCGVRDVRDRRAGVSTCAHEAWAIALDDCDAVFLSVDVDVVDPGCRPERGRRSRAGFGRGLLDPCGGWPGCRSPGSTWSRWPRRTTRPRYAYLANRIVLEALSGITASRRRRPPG